MAGVGGQVALATCFTRAGVNEWHSVIIAGPAKKRLTPRRFRLYLGHMNPQMISIRSRQQEAV